LGRETKEECRPKPWEQAAQRVRKFAVARICGVCG